MKAHKLLYDCFKQHASYIMYSEQEIQKIKKVMCLNRMNLTLQGHICKFLH